MKRLLFLTGIIAVVLATATIINAAETTVRGKLQKTVEAGGWLIVERDAKYLILNSKDFTRTSRGLKREQTSRLLASSKT